MEKEKLLEIRRKLKKRKPTFVRKDSFKKSKLGRKRRKKQKWRRPRGRHSKVREKRKSYMRQPSVGWSSPKAVKGLVTGFKPKLIYNVEDLEKLKEKEIAVVANIGKKNKIKIAEKALAKNIKLFNLNAKKFLENIKKEKKMAEENKIKAGKKEEEIVKDKVEKRAEEKVEEKKEAKEVKVEKKEEKEEEKKTEEKKEEKKEEEKEEKKEVEKEAEEKK